MWTYNSRASNEGDVLQHSGRLGMKWGVRRYQSKDGTLTSAGHKRVAKLESEHAKLTEKEKLLAPKKTVKDIGDADLRAKITRLQMEKQFAELTKAPETKKGKSVIVDILSKSGQQAASTIATAAMTYMGKQAIKSMAGEKAYKDMFNINTKEKD